MCAIAGHLCYHSGNKNSVAERLSCLSGAMRNRGPDAEGRWTSKSEQVHLAHRRLSIIDLSPAGNQPFIDAETGCALVFNGEIYNFRELRIQLEHAGYRFRSESDTEVLIKGYLHWGETVLDRLRGMFAFGLWDERKQALWLVRDPYGIKPLYYTDSANGFFFASQVKPIVEHLEIDSRPDPAGIVGFMLLGSVPEPYTCYRSVRSLPAGHELWVTTSGPGAAMCYASVAETWRNAALNPVRLDEAELNEQVRSAVLSSVQAHRVADVPVGAFLSAGIDSGSLVGMMAERRQVELRTLTLGFSSFRNSGRDETILAEQMAARYGTHHQTAWITDAQAEADWPNALADMDQPSVDGFNTWLVSKHMAAAGLKVVVSGVGGDELFGGYEHFADLPVWQRRLRRLEGVPGVMPGLAAGARIAHRLGLVHVKAEGLARLGSGLAELYLVKKGLFMPWELPQILDHELVREGLAALQPVRHLSAVIDGFSGYSYPSIAALDASFFLRNQLLRDSDWASMAHSLELRTPLVDFELLKKLAPVLVNRSTSQSGKRVLALAPNPALPDAVLNRPKSGFFLPLDRWLKQSSVLGEWRANKSLQGKRVPFARRLAYSLVAQIHPDVVIRQ
jgi:asparagine synthase (glutamine-hydrolysing)